MAIPLRHGYVEITNASGLPIGNIRSIPSYSAGANLDGCWEYAPADCLVKPAPGHTRSGDDLLESKKRAKLFGHHISLRTRPSAPRMLLALLVQLWNITEHSNNIYVPF
jgi:hypothetical protein